MAADTYLREVAQDDWGVFFEQQLDPEATHMAAFPARDRPAFMAHWEKISRDPTVVARTIVYRGRVAGNVVSFEQDAERLVGYWLGKEFWGQGIASRALGAFLEVVQVRPLYAHVARHNVGSRRVLEKCGFRQVGEAPAGDPNDGEPVIEIVMRLDTPGPPPASPAR